MRSENRRAPCAIVIALTLAFGPVPPASSSAAEQVRVVGALVNVRQGPGPSAPVLFQVKRGDVLAIVERKGNWLFIETSAGLRGYVFSQMTETVTSLPPAAPDSPPSPPQAAPSTTGP